MNTDGTGYTILNADDPFGLFQPFVRLTVSGTTLFGFEGGRGILQDDPYDASILQIYRRNIDGSGYAMLKEFTWLADNGDFPTAPLALSGSSLYGTMSAAAIVGFPSHSGRIFKLNTDGTGYTVLRTFGLTTLDTAAAVWTNSEGVMRDAELTISGSSLYGTAFAGGQFGYGTVFKMNADGTSFTVLKHLTLQQSPHPRERLTLSGNTLYGISAPEYEGQGGTVFRVNTDGTGFQVLKQFPDAVWDNDLSAYPNSEGVNPIQGLALQGNTLYGTTSRGGQFGAGTLFKVNTDGTGFAVLEHLERGGQPWDGGGLRGLVVSGSTLYGSAPWGGDRGFGAIYRIDLSPTLSIDRTGANSLAVSWPSVWTDYVLQQNSGGLGSLAWSNVTDAIQNDGKNKTLIVNPTDASRFYRLVLP
jgi:uncharacterized repeat protein (TIGR03803 family)